MNTYQTPIDAMVMPGHVTLPSGRIVSACAALDASRPRGFAQVDYRTAAAFGALHRARLISYEAISEIYEPAAKALILDPVTLPDAGQIQAHVTLYGLKPPKGSPAEQQWLRRLYAPMATREWADKGDGKIWDQLDAAGVTESDLLGGCRLVANDGKWFQYGAPPFRCYLRGWRTRGRWIQGGVPPAQVGKVPGPHQDTQHDYGTRARYEWLA
jgi:hypothetical protein